MIKLCPSNLIASQDKIQKYLKEYKKPVLDKFIFTMSGIQSKLLVMKRNNKIYPITQENNQSTEIDKEMT